MKDQDKKYEVDYVVDSQRKGQRLEYLIHWKGYDNSELIWEHLSILTHAKEIISNFIHACPNALHHLNMAYLDFIYLFHQYDSSIIYDGHNALFDHLEVDCYISPSQHMLFSFPLGLHFLFINDSSRTPDRLPLSYD